MKIRFVATPSEAVLASPAAELARVLASSGIAGFRWRGPLQELETEIAAEAVSPDAAEMRSSADGLNRSFASWSQRAVSVRAELDSAAAAPPAERDQAEISEWTPESAKLRDLNGAGAHAALPKVLAAVLSPVSQVVPGDGGGLLAVAEASNRFLALDAYRGGLIAVAECVRDQACAGARTVLLADRYAFAAQAAPSDLARLAESVRGLAEAAASFGLSVGATALASASSLAVGVTAAGRIENGGRMLPSVVQAAGQKLVLLGEAPSEIGGSRYLAAVHGVVAGTPPAVDFAAEKKLQDALLTLGDAKAILAARSVSAGGLMSAVCEMLLGPGEALGVRLDLTSLGGVRADALLFGESQGRAIVALAPERVGTVLAEAHMRGVPAALIGETAGDPVLELKTRSLATEWTMAELRKIRVASA